MRAPGALASVPARLGRFVVERFPPLAYGPLILALVLAGQSAAAIGDGSGLRLDWRTVAVAAAVALGFLQLRILDELADEATDRIGRPERPLPRGLVTAPELWSLAVSTAIGGTVLAVSLGPLPLGLYALALLQVWVLASPAARARAAGRGMVVDALAHSLVVPTMAGVAWASSARDSGLEPALLATLVLAWGAGLALEVSRKTMAEAEERPCVETYSRSLGRGRAIALMVVFLLATALAAGALALVVEAGPVVAAAPLVMVLAVAGVARARVAGFGMRRLRATASGLVLAALLWPALLSVLVR